ncbi:MAG: helix-turn-helix transcriptional regulator [Pseudomonadota bacterium]
MTLDLERFGYVVRAKREALDLTVRQLACLAGVSTRQISFAENGRSISAGGTWMLARALRIDLDEMMSTAARERLINIDRVYEREENQGVTPPVSRETVEEFQDA